MIICFFYSLNYSAFHLDFCSKDPTFCLNGGTCEVTMTGARCHCPDRYQGDRCNMCTDRHQGERCDTCADGYYGDMCSKLFKF